MKQKACTSLAAPGDAQVRRVAQLKQDQSCSGREAEPETGHQLHSSRPAAPREAQIAADGQKNHLWADISFKTLQSNYLMAATVLLSYI